MADGLGGPGGWLAGQVCPGGLNARSWTSGEAERTARFGAVANGR